MLRLLVDQGNVALDGGFVLNQDGWRCRMAHPLDLDLLAKSFAMPDTIVMSRDFYTVLDRATWCSIEGPGAHA
jgi:hypothetical protein